MNPQHVVQYHVEYSKLRYFVSIHGVHVKRHLYMVSSNGYESKWNHHGLGRPTPTLVPCWSLNPCLQGTSVGVGLPQPTTTLKFLNHGLWKLHWLDITIGVNQEPWMCKWTDMAPNHHVTM